MFGLKLWFANLRRSFESVLQFSPREQFAAFRARFVTRRMPVETDASEIQQGPDQNNLDSPAAELESAVQAAIEQAGRTVQELRQDPAETQQGNDSASEDNAFAYISRSGSPFDNEPLPNNPSALGD
ncbi:hypothetical protein PG993_003856 [Apiospora rasikravindrae]|uniref:Uncharacterized protein n=1 Tax=Apiospora rasikravindrae TaxID=990691 RepID=A0ABR1U0P8_9PEZI